MKKIADLKTLTPAMRQFIEIKDRHRDAILFFRMGDFYEMFFEDAKIASRVLGIALTSRDKERAVPMCGIPYHAAETYIAKLVKEGFKVAMCEQTEDPANAKGPVRRAVKRVITPGTALDEALLDSKVNNYIAAAVMNSKTAGFAYMDVTTGEFAVTDLEDASGLADEIKRINPSELLLAEDAAAATPAKARPDPIDFAGNVTRVGQYDFEYPVALERLTRHFQVASLDGFGLAGMREGVKAAGALLYYVKETQKEALAHVNRCTPYRAANFLVLDHSTRRNLEVSRNLRSGDKTGTLLNLLDRTVTAMGGRRLSAWLACPLVDPEGINERLDAVEAFIDNEEARTRLEETLTGVYDIERLIGRVALKVAGPRDLVSLKLSLKKIPALKEDLGAFDSPMVASIRSGLDPVNDASDLIEESIGDSPPVLIRDGGFIKDGYNKELDELREIGSGGKDWIARLEASERKLTGINTLKVGYNKVFGYFIEVTKTNLSSVPDDYIRKQTLVNAERFITPALKEWEARILTAEVTARELEARLFRDVTGALAQYTERVQLTASLVSILDCLNSFSRLSIERGYVKPVITGGESIIITQGRHPVIEAAASGAGGGETFVPNDHRLDTTEEQIIVLTGPNMAGKSTYIRQVALIVLMAQTGCFVPAERAEIGVVDRIFTRVGASDDITSGQSTFMVEMNEAANILNNATDRSLVILDEIGRGTSTFDGLSIAWAVAEYLHDTPGVRAKTLFATHYHELTELSLTKERVKNYNMSVKEWEDRVIFLRKVVAGGTNRSYGIQVARLAGMPAGVIDRAAEILKNLERGELNEAGMPRLAAGLSRRPAANSTGIDDGNDDGNGKAQATLPGLLGSRRDENLHEELMGIDTDSITPMEALTILTKLKEKLKD